MISSALKNLRLLQDNEYWSVDSKYRLIAIGLITLFFLGCHPDPKNETGAEELVTINGTIVELLNNNPMIDAQVCWTDQCTTTDDDGYYSLSVPAGEQFLTVDKADHYGGLIPFSSIEDGHTIPNVALITSALFTAQLSAVSLEENPNTGSLAFSISNGIFGDGINISGVIVSIEPVAGEGPFYTTSLGIPSTELTETSENGGGVISHLPDGDYTLSFQPLLSTCTLLLGWNSPENLVIPIQPQRVSYTRIECLTE